MWRFDEKQYSERVLAPAMKRFKADGRLPDLFDRYGLPLETDEKADIELAIKTVTAFWNKRRQHPRDKELIASLVQAKEHEEANRILVRDPKARAALRAVLAAERHREAELRFKRLDEAIALMVGRKGFLTPAERDALVAKFTPESLSRQEIEARIHVPIREPVSRLPTDEGLPEILRNQIRSSLAVVGKRNLYEFLGVKPGASRAAIEQRYRAVELEWRPRQADFRKTAAQNLLGVIKAHLVDGDPTRYEAALRWDVVEQLRREIELPAADKVITRDEFRVLLKVATSLGLSEETATDYIVALAQDPRIGASVEIEAAGDTMRCVKCSTLTARKREAARCTVCGSELWCTCPRCGKQVPLSDSACGSCGFVISALPEVQLLVRKAELHLEDGQITEAHAAAREAERLWGREGEIAALLGRIEERSRELGDRARQLNAALAEHRLVAARAIALDLAATAPDYLLPDARTARRVCHAIEADVARAEALLRDARERERAGRADDAVFACLEALALCADSPEAKQLLRHFPPAPARSVRAAIQDGAVVLDWSPSPAIGEVLYVVLRREGGPPVSANDGTAIARTRNTTCRDETAETGSFVFYGIVAHRGEVSSSVTATAGVLVAREVDGASIESGDGVTTARWSPPLRGRVRVFRCEDTEGREIEIRDAGLGKLVDQQVQNGRVYHYRVVTEYPVPGGSPVRTAGVILVAQPDAAASSVEDLRIAATGEGVELQWSPPPKGVVRVYRCATMPRWKAGAVVRSSDLAPLGSSLSLRSGSVAVDTRPPPGICFYMPVTVAGDRATIGAARRYASIPDVTGLVVQDLDSYALLRWGWSPDCTQVAVVYRSDRFPLSADEPAATSRKITRAEYDRRGGFRLEQPEGPHYITVFAAGQLEGEVAFAPGTDPGARGELRTYPIVAIRYQVTRSWYRRRRLTVRLTADGVVESLPPLVVIAKRGEVQPIHEEDGEVVLRLGGVRLAPDAPLEKEIDLGKRHLPIYLRAFLSGARAGGRYRLVSPPPAKLKVA